VFFSIFSDMGLGAAIIQKRELSRRDLKSLFSYSIYIGIILGIIFFCSSWIIAKIYDDSQLILICQLLSLNVLFATFNIVPNGLLFRDKKFKFIGIRTIVVQIVLAIVSILCAFNGLGIYSLLINPIGSSILLFAFSYAKYPMGITLKPQFGAVRKVASYSVYTFAFNLINYFTRNLDKLLIGKIFGLSPLGYYEKSYRLMLLPVQNLTQVITPVLHPVLADLQNNLKEQTVKYLKLREFLSIIGFPLSVFLFFSARELILIIFGNQWTDSIRVFQIFSLTVGFQITGSTIGAFYQSTNKTRELFIVGVINTVINVSFLFIGIFIIGNIEGVAWMWVASTIVGLWSVFYFAHIVKIKPMIAFKAYTPAIVPTLVVGIILYLCSSFIQINSLLIKLIILTMPLIITELIALRYFHFIDNIPIFKFINRRNK
ncbi:MAG: lipopolysaccharide biosynthesis protein, partial [Muribaculum sp.]|nr:lipopolysaccharide biosynthesis protein [Muribaculum sp.]